MFKTSQPNPDGSRNDPNVKKCGPNEPQFDSLVDFSEWLDEQLSNLESDHEEFFTSESMRSFFKRG